MGLTGPGIWGPPKVRKAALPVLRRAVEPVNFDTADSYGPHVSEELMAEAPHPYPSDLVIATKVGWERPRPNQWTHNATALGFPSKTCAEIAPDHPKLSRRCFCGVWRTAHKTRISIELCRI
jgi:aryl-alcohol dehydrogenase-like predicted oxidoreductase